MVTYWQVVTARGYVFGTYFNEQTAKDQAARLNLDYQTDDYRVIKRDAND